MIWKRKNNDEDFVPYVEITTDNRCRNIHDNWSYSRWYIPSQNDLENYEEYGDFEIEELKLIENL